MELVPHTGRHATLAREHRFVVNLIIRDDKIAEVRSCEVIGGHHRNRFTFPTKVSVDDVFVDRLARGITQCLSSLSGGTEVISMPTVAIEIPGLSLAKAHVITTKSDDGSLGIILRFKMLLGGITNAFRPELGIEDSVPDHTSHMSALVLTDIVMPLLDLCAAAEGGGLASSQELDNFMDTLIERSRDVRFQAELIKRFVSTASDPDQRRRPEPLEPKDPPRIELVSRR